MSASGSLATRSKRRRGSLETYLRKAPEKTPLAKHLLIRLARREAAASGSPFQVCMARFRSFWGASSGPLSEAGHELVTLLLRVHLPVTASLMRCVCAHETPIAVYPLSLLVRSSERQMSSRFAGRRLWMAVKHPAQRLFCGPRRPISIDCMREEGCAYCGRSFKGSLRLHYHEEPEIRGQ